MSGLVYIHTNQVNGKVYVGQSWDFPRRKRAYPRENSYFARALRKYGWDAFDHQYFPVETQAEMDNLEKAWILCLRATDKQCGYNLQAGGTFFGRHSDETRAKISAKASERVVSPETCRKISESHKGKPSGAKGKPAWNRGLKGQGAGRKFTPEHRVNLSNALLGNTRMIGKVPWNKGLKYQNKRTLGVSHV